MQLRETYYEVWLNDQLDFMSPSLKVCLDSARNARNRDYVSIQINPIGRRSGILNESSSLLEPTQENLLNSVP